MVNVPINLASLKQFYEQDALNELLASLLVETQKLIEQLEVDIAERNEQSLAADAHQLKGMSSSMTAIPLFQLSCNLELAAQEKDWQASSIELTKLKQALQELKEYLRLSGV